MKFIVVSSLQYLTTNKLVILYGFVIMPNHIHLLWYIRQQNNKETPVASFAKFTAHQFKERLKQNNQLQLYVSDKPDRSYQFWKRDPLAIPISSERVFLSKLAYIHNNPVKWGLCANLEDYRWSSAKFYTEGKDEFNMLTHYKA
jgi:REP element-mobilizing transposase RayT